MLACAKQPAQRRQATRQAWLGAAALALPRGAEDYAGAARQQAPSMRKQRRPKTPWHARFTPDSRQTLYCQAASWRRQGARFLLYCLTLLDIMMVVLLLSKRGLRDARRERGRGVLGAWYAAGRKTTAGRTMSTAGRRVAQHGAVQSRPHWT